MNAKRWIKRIALGTLATGVYFGSAAGLGFLVFYKLVFYPTRPAVVLENRSGQPVYDFTVRDDEGRPVYRRGQFLPDRGIRVVFLGKADPGTALGLSEAERNRKRFVGTVTFQWIPGSPEERHDLEMRREDESNDCLFVLTIAPKTVERRGCYPTLISSRHKFLD